VTLARPCCFAAVPYANAVPLAHFIPMVCPQARLVTDIPARLLERLQDGSADVAMLPVADFVAHPELTMIEGLGICSARYVRSVLLSCRRPLAEVRTLELDPASRTSNALARLLLRKHWKIAVEVVPAGAHEGADAAVVIGDRALCAAPSPAGDYDLATHWNQMTGLPFVFAVWARRRDHPDPHGLAQVAHAAKQAGLAAVAELARAEALRLGLSEALCLEYLTTCIHYDVGPPERRAMQLFAELLNEPQEAAGTPRRAARAPRPPAKPAPSCEARLSVAAALDLLKHADTAELMGRADAVRRQMHGQATYFTHSLNLNPTNVCENRCELCAFWREPDAPDAYTLTLDQARERLLAARAAGLTDLHIVGGLRETVGLEYCEALFRLAREIMPGVLIQGLTAVEIHYLARLAGISVPDTLHRLQAAGLSALPGGGAEIFGARTRERICSHKIAAAEWLEVHRQAHALGLPSNATMLFGHLETPEDIVDHLARLRELQDATGGFRAFIPLPFQPRGTRLPVSRGPGGYPSARVVALARLFLDNFQHVRVLGNYFDRKVLQVMLYSGVDDLGGTSLDERIARAAGAPQDQGFGGVEEMAAFVRAVGLEPVLVNSLYRPAAPLPTPAPSAARRRTGPSAALSAALRQAERHERLSAADALALHDEASVHQLGALAEQRRRRQVPGNLGTFVVDRNISITNVCEAGCKFCAFHVAPGSPRAFALSIDEIVRQVVESVERGASQVLLQGGLNPDLDIRFYEQMLAAIKQRVQVCLHSLSPAEVHYLARRAGLTLRQALERLRLAGLDSLPGGGAEILVDAVRREVSPHKISSADWLAVMEAAQGLGMRTTATMVYGLGETGAQRVEHLLRLRELQDRTGGFTAFIPWSFQSSRTQWPQPPASGLEYLRIVALARLVLDNVAHIQAGWVTEGPDLAQLALAFGADDFGGVLMEEQVVRATGTSYAIAPDQVIALIAQTGLTPAERDTQYAIRRVYERLPAS
jgi:dehypoxanthine futalosine cyclase